MATRRWSLAPSGGTNDIVEAEGAATATAAIEVTVDLANTAVNDGSGTRSVRSGEVLAALRLIEAEIVRRLGALT